MVQTLLVTKLCGVALAISTVVTHAWPLCFVINGCVLPRSHQASAEMMVHIGPVGGTGDHVMPMAKLI